jgi:hypothetical protein
MFDAVCANLKKHPADAQIDVDTDVVAKALHDGRIDVRELLESHVNKLKGNDKQIFMSSLHCKDPADVSAAINPSDPNKIDFSVDFWRANTNSIYETAKGHAVTPALIAGADQALNDINGIPVDDRDQAVGQFNDRARTDKQPMRIDVNPQSGEIELKALNSNVTASK